MRSIEYEKESGWNNGFDGDGDGAVERHVSHEIISRWFQAF